jgi:RND superfamily putative drug exporter
VFCLDNTIIEKISKMMSGKVSRWVVIVIWILAAIILSISFPAVGNRTQDNAANLPADADSVIAHELMKKEFPNSLGVPALLTWHREGGLTDTDFEEIQYLAHELTKNPLPQQSYLPPLDQVPLPALKSSVS